MAFLGDLGKAFGWGKTGDVVTAVTGSEWLGNKAQAVADYTGSATDAPGATNTAQNNPPIETAIALPTIGPVIGTGTRILQGTKNFLTGPGGVATGLGLGLGADLLGGSGSNEMRITRKQQKMVKDLVMIVGIEAAADMLNLSIPQVAQIMIKKFRRRGAGITASQMRTTQRTINKICHMHNKLEMQFKKSTTTRRAPARSSTRITNVK